MALTGLEFEIVCCDGSRLIRMLGRCHGASASSTEAWVAARGLVLGGEREDEGSPVPISGGSGVRDIFARRGCSSRMQRESSR